MRPLVKICGLKRVEDAELSVSLGANLVGAVRTPSSPRRVSVDEARALGHLVLRDAELFTSHLLHAIKNACGHIYNTFTGQCILPARPPDRIHRPRA